MTDPIFMKGDLKMLERLKQFLTLVLPPPFILLPKTIKRKVDESIKEIGKCKCDKGDK